MRFSRARAESCAWVLAAGLGVCVLSSSAFGWTLQFDPPRRVHGDTLTVAVNHADCPGNLDVLIDAALDIWNSVPSSFLKIERRGESPDTGAQVMGGSNNDFAIVCDPHYGASTGGDVNQTLATTLASLDGQGFIARGGVVINVQTDVFLTNSEDQKIFVLAHEIGHVFGLGHSSEPKAIMYFQERSSGAKPTIAQDDVDGVTFLYPRNEAKSDQGKLFGCGALENSSKPPTPPTAGLGALVSFFGMLWLACQMIKGRVLRFFY